MKVSEDMKLESLASSLEQALNMKFVSMFSALDMLEHSLQSSFPENILRKGYVMLLDGDGRRFSSVSGKRPGDPVAVMLSDGVLDCRIEAVSERDKVD